uniref:Uncharacterized protein n=2 Tax=Sus scrofa TaxID=9823 RepID=A0A8D0ZZM5_PIG
MAAVVLHTLGLASISSFQSQDTPCSLLPGLQKLASCNNRPREDHWLKFLFVWKFLAKKQMSSLYKLQFHYVKLECLEAYSKICQEILPKIHEDKHYPCTLVGTWNMCYGKQDQSVHFWRTIVEWGNYWDN